MKDNNFEFNNNYLNIEPTYKMVYWFGGLISFIFIAYSIITIIVMVLIGTPPETAIECFKMLNENKLFGLLRLDILTVFVMPLYYILFYSIFIALRKSKNELTIISTLLIYVGLTLFLATPSVFSCLHLSEKFATATNEIQRNQIISACEAILASDMWHGTGAKIGGILTQLGTLFLSIIMLKNNIFNKATAIIGILTHGLDLLHIIITFFLPAIGTILMSIAGILYLIWFPLVGFRLFRLSKYCEK